MRPSEYDPPDAEVVSAELYVAIARMLRHLRTVTSDAALTASQVSVLTRVAKGEAATASALARLERMTPQSMAVIITGLVKRGLVERAADPTDGRRQLITLTHAGAVAEGGNREARTAWLAQAVSTLIPDDQRALLRAAQLLDALVHV